MVRIEFVFVMHLSHAAFSPAAHEHWISQMFTIIVGTTSVLTALLLILLGVCIYRCKQVSHLILY